jgi:membrane peptidoglycan carboxypeptidase
VQTLAYIENREILDDPSPNRNPSVEWDRFTKAIIDLGLNRLHASHPVSGGSTLATQLEKIRHSQGGFTQAPSEKAIQMASASVRAYLDGENTIEARRRIITDYLNSIPLAAIEGYGEVRGLGDGLWAWFGADFETVNQLLSNPNASAETALAYRQTLCLLMALKRPTYFLKENPAALRTRVNAYLRMLAADGIVPGSLSRAALTINLTPRKQVPDQAPRLFAERKATDAIRAELLGMLGLGSLYELDRLDLTVNSTLDAQANSRVSHALANFRDLDHAASAGLTGGRLLSGGDPGKVVYSLTVYERGENGNILRLQADNYDQPLNINQGTRLELGSTAKLRTLVHYLEIVAQLHKNRSTSPVYPKDRITRWAREWLATAPDPSLPAMLEAAMNRYYSASPAESFFTGGGLHTFSNFESKDNARSMTVREAFQRSVNLVFIRLMRDITWYHLMRLPDVTASTLNDDRDPARLRYLRQFADEEGSVFLTRFYLARRQGQSSHPLALWLEEYLKVHPNAGLEEVLAASATQRQLAYDWLFRSRHKSARDKRVLITLEAEAFRRIHIAWQRLGYPFPNLTPSYATAIGSSGDNPAALAELVGIILNDGARYPASRIHRLQFGAHTPFETILEKQPSAPAQVLPREVATMIRREMIGVVEQGTGRRAAGGIVLPNGTRLAVGGKTGTGDNRFAKRPVNRTATFAFFVGDRFFGVVTAFVDGRQAADYQFTSALPVQVFKHLQDVFAELAASS